MAPMAPTTTSPPESATAVGYFLNHPDMAADQNACST